MLPFVKMHGLGNDYLYVYGTPYANAADLSRKLSDRHFGIGSDGMIWITPPTDPKTADFGMRIFNADGSEAAMCGNGIRCVGKYVYDRRLSDKTTLTIETKAGLRTLTLHPDENRTVTAVTVDMGIAVTEQPRTLSVDAATLIAVPVSVGNPHAVVFTDDADGFPMQLLAAVSTHSSFAGGVNAECAAMMPNGDIRMRVCERGSGITLACGTGACAVCAAAVARGLIPADKPITVHLDGGDLTVAVRADGHVFMTGEAVTVCEGSAVI